MQPSQCSIFSPALPSELLTYILNQHNHNTTLIICCSRAEFLLSLIDDIQEEAESEEEQDDEHSREQKQRPGKRHPLLSSPIYQVAISRHIRTVYVPTVTHLRAYLSSTLIESARSLSDPSSNQGAHSRRNNPDSGSATEAAVAQRPRQLILYGFLDLHRHTSEWSAQGIGSSAADLVELSDQLGWSVMIVEPRRRPRRWRHDSRGTSAEAHGLGHEGRVDTGANRSITPDVLDEEQNLNTTIDLDTDHGPTGEYRLGREKAGEGARNHEESMDEDNELVGLNVDYDNDGHDSEEDSSNNNNDSDIDHTEPDPPKPPLESLLEETMPILSGGGGLRRRLLGLDAEGGGGGGGGWSGRTVQVGMVMGRWFRFRRAAWDPTLSTS